MTGLLNPSQKELVVKKTFKRNRDLYYNGKRVHLFLINVSSYREEVKSGIYFEKLMRKHEKLDRRVVSFNYGFLLVGLLFSRELCFLISGETYALNFWWQYQLCDVYIEAIKPYFAGDSSTFASERAHAHHALWVCLEIGLRLLHPLTPFVTEELWQRLPSPKHIERKTTIMICDYPVCYRNLVKRKGGNRNEN